MLSFAVTALLVVAAGAYLSPPYRPLVTTLEGRVRGFTDRSARGRLFYSFRGIPYAQPPERFEPPRRHPGWHGTLEALEYGSICAQFQFTDAARAGSEDCLFVNVYSRQVPDRCSATGAAGLPVIVYLHGGGFFSGSGNEAGPHYFMDEDVVLVTFNFRVGPFGFFTTHDAAAPGNYGLLDQVLLLQWVQDNIAAFGGDPRLVTLLGQSAGGTSTSILVLSPLAKGLFHHAISKSGASFSTAGAKGKQRGLAVKLGTQLGCPVRNSRALVECVKRTPLQVLKDAFQAIGEHDRLGFLPRADPERYAPVLPADPRTILASGNFNLVPWVSGMVSLEAELLLPRRLPTAEFVDQIMRKNLTAWSMLLEFVGESEFPILDCGADPITETRRVLDFFFSREPVTARAITEILSNRLFQVEISEEIRLASAHAPVYKYFFDHLGPGRLTLGDPPNLPPNLPSVIQFGVTHSEDNLYIFSSDERPREQPGTPAYRMVRFMVNLWANFARTGRPSSNELPMPDWPIFTEQSERHMHINLQPTVERRLFGERIDFWQMVRVNEQWRHELNRSPCF